MRRNRWRSDGGAMALLLAVVMVAVAVPITGFAVTQFVRNGLQGELQRAADQGALAGSAMIPLADVSSVRSTVASLPTGVGSTAVLIPPNWCTKGPVENGSSVNDVNAGGTCALDVACKNALSSIAVDRAFGHGYATPYGAPNCTAVYADDTNFFSQFSSCVNATTSNALGSLTAVPTVTGLLGSLLGYIGLPAGLVSNTAPLALASVLPSLLKPGVSVTMSWQQRGPLDALTPGDNGSTHLMSRTATAKRAFKNVVVLPTTGVTGSLIPVIKNAPVVGSGTVLDLSTITDYAANPNLLVSSVMPALRTTLNALDAIIGAVLPSCATIVDNLNSDLDDLLAPAVNAPTLIDVVNDARTNATPLLALMIPTTITSGLQIPFLDFVPVCLSQAGNVAVASHAVVQTTGSTVAVTNSPSVSSIASCTIAAPGLFRGRLAS